MPAQKITEDFRKTPPLSPYRQGHFDALCGVYSIVNAIQWVCKNEKPLSKYRAGQIAEYGLTYLISNGRLDGVILDGMSNRLWRTLMRKMIDFTNGRFGYDLVISEVVQQTPLKETLYQKLNGLTVLLIHLKGAFNHYTVITGYQGKRWVLCDSDGMRYIRQSSIKASFERKESRYSFTKNGLFLIEIK